jgi:hypothetical protein
MPRRRRVQRERENNKKAMQAGEKTVAESERET